MISKFAKIIAEYDNLNSFIDEHFKEYDFFDMIRVKKEDYEEFLNENKLENNINSLEDYIYEICMEHKVIHNYYEYLEEDYFIEEVGEYDNNVTIIFKLNYEKLDIERISKFKLIECLGDKK
jgi:hypothetical protein